MTLLFDNSVGSHEKFHCIYAALYAADIPILYVVGNWQMC